MSWGERSTSASAVKGSTVASTWGEGATTYVGTTAASVGDGKTTWGEGTTATLLVQGVKTWGEGATAISVGKGSQLGLGIKQISRAAAAYINFQCRAWP